MEGGGRRGRGTEDGGEWTMDRGRWTMGRWTMDRGRWREDHGPRTMDGGRGPWSIVYRLLSIVCRLW
jgi:hypothetical protein